MPPLAMIGNRRQVRQSVNLFSIPKFLFLSFSPRSALRRNRLNGIFISSHDRGKPRGPNLILRLVMASGSLAVKNIALTKLV